MPEVWDSLLRDLPTEDVPVDLTARVRAHLASARRREARMRIAVWTGMLALGVVSGAVLWPALVSLLESLVRGFPQTAAPAVAGLWQAPGTTLWELAQSILGWGGQVSLGLGASGMIALMFLAVLAILGLTWTLGGRTEEASA
ncbi:MAG TPA: hypothetical protein VFI11_08000 [Anaerolineales bacterium]|nr:hypothetical protein [Anaerolineales bacterium]